METKRPIQICMGSSCFSRGNSLNVEFLQRLLAEGTELELMYGISGSLCEGHCKDGPIVVIDGVMHSHVTPSMLQDLLR
ncbi:hypothetical protein MASR2M78_13170 [Treponema sp.]